MTSEARQTGYRFDPADAGGFPQQLDETVRLVEDALDRLLPNRDGRVGKLDRAVRHAVFAGGKRLRPFLAIHSAGLFQVPVRQSVRVAAAIEMLHTYSLIHDDLPCMDDDSLRRGKPTVHVAYDEATAVLAGDGLLTEAFAVMSAPETSGDPTISRRLVQSLARAAGAGGMVGGQILDLAGETAAFNVDDILAMEALKTGAILAYSAESGAILAGAAEAECRRLHEFGQKLGLAFQIADDLLDGEADTAQLGKTSGKDEAKGKATLVALWGKEDARGHAVQLISDAVQLLAPYGETAAPLRDLAKFVINRKY